MAALHAAMSPMSPRVFRGQARDRAHTAHHCQNGLVFGSTRSHTIAHLFISVKQAHCADRQLGMT